MTTPPITLLRTLPISAASGLVAHGDFLFVVADDEHHLSVLSRHDDNFHRTLRLFEGELPDQKKARKKQKPDLEALAHLPPSHQHPHGALLAIGSGSKPNRERAVLVTLGADGLPNANITTITLGPLYRQLPFSDLNIEGAVVTGHTVRLLQRGNKGSNENALIHCTLESLLEGNPSPQITTVSLPSMRGVPLGFTDACALPDGRLLFSAVAEDTSDSYTDGACIATALGVLDASGNLQQLQMLPHPHKIEGIALANPHGTRLYAVTDADDPNVPAKLLGVEGWRNP